MPQLFALVCLPFLRVLQCLLFSSGFVLELFGLGRRGCRRGFLPLFHLSSLPLHFLCLLFDTLFFCLLQGLGPDSLFIGQLLEPGGLLFRGNASPFCLLGRLALSFLFEFCRLLGGGTFSSGRLLLGL